MTRYLSIYLSKMAHDTGSRSHPSYRRLPSFNVAGPAPLPSASGEPTRPVLRTDSSTGLLNQNPTDGRTSRTEKLSVSDDSV